MLEIFTANEHAPNSCPNFFVELSWAGLLRGFFVYNWRPAGSKAGAAGVQ
jgi:hypothetical protein